MLSTVEPNLDLETKTVINYIKNYQTSKIHTKNMSAM